MTKNQILMRQAKQMLAGNWGNVALATLIYMIIIGVVSCSYVGQLILIGPISVGYVLFIMAVCDRRIVDFGNLFKGFDNFVQTLVAGLIYSIAVSIYNPQNEKIVFCKTKRTIPQNEAYPEKSFFDAVEYNKSTLKVAFVSLHDICDTQAATSLVVGSV